MRIKTYIQEQNSCAGLTNRLLSKYVNRIFTAYDGMEKFFPKDKTLNLGNPVRKSLKIDRVSKKESRNFFGLKEDVFTVLVVGGSLGAEPINAVICHILDDMQASMSECIRADYGDGTFKPNYTQLIWQTGESKFNFYKEKFGEEGFVSIHKFINRMDLAYHAADIVISRAGAIAISEICFLSKASILIPSPYVTDNHQLINARYLEKYNGCLILEEDASVAHPLTLFSSLTFFARVFSLESFTFPDIEGLDLINDQPRLDGFPEMHSKDIREKIGRNANQLFKYNAAEEIASIVLKEIK